MRWVLVIGILGLGNGVHGGDLSFWVWGRTESLESTQVEALEAAGVGALFWHVADGQLGADGWELRPTTMGPPRAGGIEVVPVIRLEAGARSVDDPARYEELARLVGGLVERLGARRLQIDFDCPDPLLGKYAEMLVAIRREAGVESLSATALAGWPGVTGFGKLAESVDGLFPMFYDLRADGAQDVAAGRFEAMIDAGDLIERWGGCAVPWWVGLPAFARVTIFEKSGKLVGHPRRWDWDELIFHPDLRPRVGGDVGTMVADVVRDSRLGDVGLERGQVVVARFPERAGLAAAARGALEAGAVGVVWFSLPEDGSLRGVAELAGVARGETGEVVARVTLDARGRLELTNVGTASLPPRWLGRMGATDRGWQLEVETGGGFRFASAGEFVRVAGHRDPEEVVPERVPVGEAERLTFWFSRLGAEESLRSGVVELRDLGSDDLRWRLDGGDWHSVERRSPLR